jgi:predicted nucleic acid-binding protein
MRSLHAAETEDEALAHARHWLDRCAGIALPKQIFQTAGALAVRRRLRSLDAIHVAAALSMGTALRKFVTYDKRLAEAARAEGFSVAMPGIEID